MDFKTLAKQYGTPLYVYDFEKIKNNFLAYKNAFHARKSLICYALKANSNLSILAQIAALEGGADCVSIGEVRRALKAGIKPYKIIFSGVGKRDDEIKEALDSEILFLNVESSDELLRIEAIAKENNKNARISIRVNPDIDPKTHPYISTGLSENKFGVEIEEAKKLYLYAHKSDFLSPIGIHFHIGSQLTELEPILQSAQKIASFTKSLIALGLDIKFFDVGGGIGICYKDENTIDLYDYAQGILAAIKGLDVTIICEPGRSVVGESGYLITKVISQKQHKNKHFVIIDGAMNDLLRPSLYDAYHHPNHLPQKKSKANNLKPVDIVGPICESGDFLAKNVWLGEIENGDLIIFENAGAYGYSMSSNYNTRARACEIGIIENKAHIIKPREKINQLFENELQGLAILEDILNSRG